ncbi:MAG TPA: short-chain dehydrogenase, partial [Phycisphaerales bacterium]|nr:short-chain dehydrogenase [Phycisphaerales bacterium]
FIEVLRVGLVAPYYLCMLFKDYFARNASVVNISSTRASQSQRDTESYSAAKGGITSLTHALAMSFAGNVRVNSIMPGWIDVSPWQQDGIDAQVSVPDMVQHPSGRIGRAEDVAAMVFFLCGHEAAFIDGESIVIDGGMTRRMIYHNDEGWALKADFS